MLVVVLGNMLCLSHGMELTYIAIVLMDLQVYCVGIHIAKTPKSKGLYLIKRG